MESEDLEKVNTTVDNGKEWLDSHQSEECDEYESKMKEYEDVISPIITKLSQSGGMPGGMPDFSGGGMPDKGTETVEEVD